MNYTFCTIITSDYFGYSQALYDTLKQFHNNVTLYVLVVDDEIKSDLAGIKTIGLGDLKSIGNAKKLIKKYGKDHRSALRWTLKPILLKYLLTEKDIDKILFVDPDLGFFGDYSFLFEKLDTKNVLLTPHWREIYPSKDQEQFQLVFKEGLYNAGFFGVNKYGLDALDWWAEACLEECSKDVTPGFFVDQSYLNVLPVYFDEVEVLTHQGCNLAAWNRKVCKRSKEDGEPIVNKQFPVVFIHFTPSTIRGILSSKDKHLRNYLRTYLSLLSDYGIEAKLPEKGSLEKLYQKTRSFLKSA